MKIWLTLLCATLIAPPAYAQEGSQVVEDVLREIPVLPPIEWNPKWGEIDAVDFTVIGSGAALALAAALIGPINEKPSHGILFDEDARDALSQGTTRSRYRARDTSDVLLSLLVTTPFFIDAFILAYFYRDSPEVAYNMAIIDAQAIAVTAGIQGATNVIASRERPYGRDCGGALPGNLHDCVGSKRYRSFFSGHSSLAFTGAGLICSHHLRLGLLGGGALDAATCIVSLAGAAATATLRVVGDVHYASDIITGAVVGTLVGFLVPALHYGFGEGSPDGTALNLSIAPSANGLSVVGSF